MNEAGLLLSLMNVGVELSSLVMEGKVKLIEIEHSTVGDRRERHCLNSRNPLLKECPAC